MRKKIADILYSLYRKLGNPEDYGYIRKSKVILYICEKQAENKDRLKIIKDLEDLKELVNAE